MKAVTEVDKASNASTRSDDNLGKDAGMEIATTRFGKLWIDERDTLTFIGGLIGMESSTQWVLLADAENDALGWLQSLNRPELAVAVVSPRRFVPDYQVRISARDLVPLGMRNPEESQVVVIVSKVEDTLAVNLKAPLVIDVEARRARQVIAKDDHAVQYLLGATLPFRKSA